MPQTIATVNAIVAHCLEDYCQSMLIQIDGGCNVPDDLLDLVDLIIDAAKAPDDFAVESLLLARSEELAMERDDRECIRFVTTDGVHGVLFGWK